MKLYKTHQYLNSFSSKDGESYENMANLYAQPRKCSQQHKHISGQEEGELHTSIIQQNVNKTFTTNIHKLKNVPLNISPGIDYINPDKDRLQDLTYTDTGQLFYNITFFEICLVIDDMK